ncbi:hypothetical protein [Streptomyces anulatus]|uniref:hypothetical protein n=1 Tax=Streptomyces anulatus TaxID=1892 RepID=UPI00368820E3
MLRLSVQVSASVEGGSASSGLLLGAVAGGESVAGAASSPPVRINAPATATEAAAETVLAVRCSRIVCRTLVAAKRALSVPVWSVRWR